MFAKDFLKGKVALVTGASRGIGRGIALALAESGADVAVHYARKSSMANEVVKEIETTGRRAVAVKANLAEHEKTESMLDEVEKVFGGCDIFIANAASGGFRPMMETNDKHWDWAMDVNARSILHCVQRLAPHMQRQRWGRVVTVSSLGAVRTVPNYGAVGLSKSVIESLTRYLAVELAPKGIIVNAVSPGLVETDALSFMDMDVKSALDFVRGRNPTRRLVTPRDVGQVAAFLCSDAAEMIVGQTIYVDGGFSLLTDYFPQLERMENAP
ncbi:MAG: enoyl-[acyl-carrier-protein] reductase FabL [Chloroflexi bacterium]|nr:enoyl-[acyl-carrier-protein] reductase FabL [Chloroflexota bacterium]